jgi:hypothetical protein
MPAVSASIEVVTPPLLGVAQNRVRLVESLGAGQVLSNLLGIIPGQVRVMLFHQLAVRGLDDLWVCPRLDL